MNTPPSNPPPASPASPASSGEPGHEALEALFARTAAAPTGAVRDRLLGRAREVVERRVRQRRLFRLVVWPMALAAAAAIAFLGVAPKPESIRVRPMAARPVAPAPSPAPAAPAPRNAEEPRMEPDLGEAIALLGVDDEPDPLDLGSLMDDDDAPTREPANDDGPGGI